MLIVANKKIPESVELAHFIMSGAAQDRAIRLAVQTGDGPKLDYYTKLIAEVGGANRDRGPQK